MSMSSVSPCKDCVDRTTVCHDSCKKYKEWSGERIRLREEDRKRRACIRHVSENQYRESMKRLYKKKGR